MTLSPKPRKRPVNMLVDETLIDRLDEVAYATSRKRTEVVLYCIQKILPVLERDIAKGREALAVQESLEQKAAEVKP